jgi:23S rRNA (uracil1939-C5)-methyltransferase
MTDQTGETSWPEIEIGSLSHDGRGVGRNDNGKVVFIDYALPGERVRYRPTGRRRKFDSGTTLEVIRSADERVTPRCAVFGTCGGSVMQHYDHSSQVTAKQNQLLKNLDKIGGVIPGTVDVPLQAEQWGYRRRARLGVRDVPKKGGILVGFRERNKSYVTPISHCEVLHPAAAKLLDDLQRTISGLSCRNRVPQVEVAVADNATALVFRNLETFKDADLDLLREFAKQNSIQVFLQPGNLDSVYPLHPENPPELYYRLEEHDINMYFLPTDFIQVNGAVNELLVERVIAALDPGEGDSVLDLFCGIGNFTLPLARRGAQLLGVEGDAGLIERARINGQRNGIKNAEFLAMDLFDEAGHMEWMSRKFDKVLLDPPRSGALNMVMHMENMRPGTLVYVSCNPATLARDAGILVNNLGYRMKSAGVIDMFPHTAHVESMAVFEQA